MQHSQFYDPHDDDRPEDRPGRRVEAARIRRHARAKRRWTYQGAGTVVAGAVALAAVTAGTFVLGGTGGDGAPLGTGAVDPVRTQGGGAGVTGDGAHASQAAATVGPGSTAPAAPVTAAPPTGTSTASAAGSVPPSAGIPAAASPAPSAPASPRGPGSDPQRAAEPGTVAPPPRPFDAGGTPDTGAAPSATPRAGQPPQAGAAPAGTAADHVRRVVDLANAERARTGCPALRVNSRLQRAAQAHADDMARRNYYQHDTPEGRDAGDRMRKAGYRWSTWGENIHRGPKDPAAAMRDWMNSPGHRENILNCAFRDIGVGVNLRSNGPWWVQNFGVAG
ncbi:hypothetical protein BJP40_17920 [Streptomyces sp. CC53]|uniref:CAP domain-containing protein n=1 Tax=unclassified Streptomyces TaxID=2593676 RepID=UPI0008DDA9FC|nr:MULTISPECIES: CAP domain-containing protein [unclassified Streptomyces]OII65131.1 hypothetical protein BJP40_17920 [Streptomyces sp. CC53]